MQLSHKIQLDPTVKQQQYLQQAVGTSRFVYNWALAEWKRQYEAGEKPTAYKLKKVFNAVKYDEYPWMKDIHRDAHARPFNNLSVAYQNFFAGRTEKPKRKTRKKSKQSFYIANDKLRVEEKKVRIPKLGWIRMTEELRFKGHILCATVSKRADRWFISITVEAGRIEKERICDGTVGIDLGLKSFAVTSDGEVIDHPKVFKQNQKRLRRANKALHRKKLGSKNREKARRRLAQVHYRISNLRQDFLHKLSTQVCRENQVVCLEDLAVKNMTKNRKLAKSISDSGWSEFRRQLEYKAPMYGSRVVIIGRFEPTSKRCSNCSWKNEDLSLKDRIFCCQECGLSIDRDLNAAINIHTLGLREIQACGHDVRLKTDSTSVGPVNAVVVEAGTNPCSQVSTL